MTYPRSDVDYTAGKGNRKNQPRAFPTVKNLTSRDGGGNGDGEGAKWESRCRICNSPMGEDVMATVNQLLVSGARYSDILKAVRVYNNYLPANKKITENSIRVHYKRHLPFESAAIRRIIEQRAEQMNKDFIQGEENLIDDIVYAQVMMRKGFQTMVEDKEKISPADGLKAAAYVRQIMSDEAGNADILLLQNQVTRILDAVKKNTSEEQWNAIVRDLDTQTNELTDGTMESEEIIEPEQEYDN